MSKSLNARCIRRWEVEFKSRCDSKFSPHWRKRDLKRSIRECALITAESLVDSLAYNDAMLDYFAEVGDSSGWSPDFSAWYRCRSEKYLAEALKYLNENATNDEINEEITNELEAWND